MCNISTGWLLLLFCERPIFVSCHVFLVKVMHLLLLVSGNAAPILERLGVAAEDVHVVKVDEKLVAAPRRALAFVRQQRYTSIIWGCKALAYQRFQPMMALYACCSHSKGGIIADEEGHVTRCSLVRLLVRDVPMFVLECCAAAVVAAVAFVGLPMLKRRVLKRQILKQ
jgi:hypothetical protein